MQSYEDLVTRWKALRPRGDVSVREVACEGVPRTLLCAEIGQAHLPSIIIAAGVHGDEPAGPWALLAMAEGAELDPAFAYRLWPCTNPSGFAAGTRENAQAQDINRTFGRGGGTPEARAVLTSNRDRKFVLAIDLHEDDTAGGFYCYAYGADAPGGAVATAVRAGGFTLENEPVLRPKPHLETQALGGMSFTLALARRAAARALTLETPVALALEQRIEIHRVAVKAAIAALSNLEHHG